MTRWETRYSPSEMAYLEIVGDKVISYLNTPSNLEGRWSFDDVLAGKADFSLNIPFGPEVVSELKAELRRRIQS